MRSLLALLPFAAGCADESLFDQDQQVVYGVLDTQVFLYDQNIVGRPAGAQDVVASCPLGGTARIAGQTSQDVNAVIDLTIVLEGCASSGSGYDLTMDGEIHWSGSFRTSGYKALSTASDSLRVIGDVDAAEGVDEDCALAVTDRGEDGQASVVSGEWCGREIQF